MFQEINRGLRNHLSPEFCKEIIKMCNSNTLQVKCCNTMYNLNLCKKWSSNVNDEKHSNHMILLIVSVGPERTILHACSILLKRQKQNNSLTVFNLANHRYK
jgi:hypothetical protein